jgi:hypothetical protein
VQITYTNNSPDTLRYVWIQADQNCTAVAARLSAVSGRLALGWRGFRAATFTDVRVNEASVQPRHQ